MALSVGEGDGCRGWRDWAGKKKEKELMDMDNSVVIAGGGEWREVEEGKGGK